MIYPVTEQYKNTIATNIASDINKLIVNDTDEFTDISSSIVDSVIIAKLSFGAYINPNVTNLKLLDSLNNIIVDADVATEIVDGPHQNTMEFKFTII